MPSAASSAAGASVVAGPSSITCRSPPPMAVQRGHRAREGHVAAVEHGDALREAVQLLDPLRRPQHGGAGGRALGGEVAHLLGGDRVEVVRGLVDEQQLGIREQGARERQPLLHPVRVGADRPAPPRRRGRRPPAARASAPARRGGAGRAGGRRRRGSRGRTGAGRTCGRPAGPCRSARAARASGRRGGRARGPSRQLGSTRPLRIRISVVLPAPLGPSSACTSPAATSRSMPLRASHGAEAAMQALDLDGGTGRERPHGGDRHVLTVRPVAARLP